MKTIKINQSAVKVILNGEECEKYEFIKGEGTSDSEMLSSLDRLLDEIHKREGISLIGKKLLVQIYPCPDLGCEIYICDTEEERMYKEKSIHTGLKRSPYISVYRFDSLDMLASACARLNGLTDDTGSEAYYDSEKEKYYLLCRAVAPREIRFAFMGEYSKVLKPPFAHYVREHFRCICGENAIKKFSKII